MKIRTVVAAFAALGFLSSTAGAFDYKAHRDFSYLNAVGVWSYGGRTVSAPKKTTLFTEFVTDSIPGVDKFGRGNTIVAVNTTGKAFNATDNNTVVIPDNTLFMHPSTEEDAVVIFKVPSPGTYRFEGFFQIMDTSPTGTVVYALRNAKTILQKELNGKGAKRDDRNPKGGKKISFDFALDDLRAGDKITFGVNAAGNWTFDTTAFDVRVTPPSP